MGKLTKFPGEVLIKAYLLSSGSEAVEACIKIMRLYGLKKSKGPVIYCCFRKLAW